MTGFNIQIEPEALAPLICQVVTETVRALEADRARIPGNRLAFSEVEAAGLLGLRVHQLRDIRLRGQIGFSRGPARRVMYQPSDLLDYLARGRTAPSANGHAPEVPAVGLRKDAAGDAHKPRAKRRGARDS
jgi:hypothetical protein